MCPFGSNGTKLPTGGPNSGWGTCLITSLGPTWMTFWFATCGGASCGGASSVGGPGGGDGTPRSMGKLTGCWIGQDGSHTPTRGADLCTKANGSAKWHPVKWAAEPFERSPYRRRLRSTYRGWLYSKLHSTHPRRQLWCLVLYTPVVKYAGVGYLKKKIIHVPSPELNCPTQRLLKARRHSQPLTVIQNVPQIGLVPLCFFCPTAIHYNVDVLFPYQGGEVFWLSLFMKSSRGIIINLWIKLLISHNNYGWQ